LLPLPLEFLLRLQLPLFRGLLPLFARFSFPCLANLGFP
jgi:hypothetical protein